MISTRYLVAIAMAFLMALLLLPIQMPQVALADTGAIPTVTNPVTQYPWAMIGHDSYGQSFSPGPGPKTNHLLWKRDLGFEVASLNVWKGKVHAPVYGSGIGYALDAQTGETIYVTPRDGCTRSLVMQPIDRYGIYEQYDMLVRAAGSKVVAYVEGTGEQIWELTGLPSGGKGYITSYRDPMGGTGTPYVSKAHIIHATQGLQSYSSEGALEWYVGQALGRENYRAGDPFPSGQTGPNAVGDLQYYAGGCSCGVAIAYPSPDGTSIWVTSPLGRFSGQQEWVPSLHRDLTFPQYPASNYTDNELFARVLGATVTVNGSNGNIFWGHPEQVVSCNSPIYLVSPNGRAMVIMGATDWKVEKSVCDAFGFEYIPAPPGSAMLGWLWAYDAYTGEQLWEWTEEAVGNPKATPSPQSIYMNNKLYFGSYADSVFCLNPDTAEVLWWRDAMGAMGGATAGPVAADGIVYAGGAPWRVYGAMATLTALDGETGETVWTYDTPAPMKHQGAVADGILYWPTGDGFVYAFGDGPTKTSLDLSTQQLKAGDTILISGQILDQSPASSGNFNAPVADAPVTLMYAPLGSVDIQTISTVTTSYSGDYYYEWTVPETVSGMYSVVASYAGTPGYKGSSATINFKSGTAGFTQAELDQLAAALPAGTDYMPMFYTVIAIAVIALAVSIYSAFVKKK